MKSAIAMILGILLAPLAHGQNIESANQDLVVIDRGALQIFMRNSQVSLQSLESSEDLDAIVNGLKKIILESHANKKTTELLMRILINQAMVSVVGVYNETGTTLIQAPILPMGYYPGLKLAILKKSISLALKYYTHDQQWVRSGTYSSLSHSKAAFELLNERMIWAEHILDVPTEQKFLAQSLTLFQNLLALSPVDERNMFAEELVQIEFGQTLVSQASEVTKARERAQLCLYEGSPKVGIQPRAKPTVQDPLKREITAQKIFGLAVGDSFFCVITKARGEVLCMGDNFASKLGVSSDKTWGKDYYDDSVARPGIYGAVQLSIHMDSTCALIEDGRIQCFGKYWGGNSITTLQNVYRKMPRFKSIAMGGEKNCGISVNDELWCWDDDRRRWKYDSNDYFTGPHIVELRSKPLKVSMAGSLLCILNEDFEVSCTEYFVNGSRADTYAPRKDGVWVHKEKYFYRQGSRNKLVDLRAFDLNHNSKNGRIVWGGIEEDGTLVGTIAKDFGITDRYVKLAGNDGVKCALTDQGDVTCVGTNMNWRGQDKRRFEGDRLVLKEKALDVSANGIGGNLACAILVGNQVSCWGASGGDFREKGSQENPIDFDDFLN